MRGRVEEACLDDAAALQRHRDHVAGHRGRAYIRPLGKLDRAGYLHRRAFPADHDPVSDGTEQGEEAEAHEQAGEGGEAAQLAQHPLGRRVELVVV